MVLLVLVLGGMVLVEMVLGGMVLVLSRLVVVLMLVLNSGLLDCWTPRTPAVVQVQPCTDGGISTSWTLHTRGSKVCFFLVSGLLKRHYFILNFTFLSL